jgi:two-component system cell cycle sensor histidine kinase/response regulator CckA
MAAPLADPAPVVLVVDDEPVVLRLMERALVAAGYQVLAASNGLRAIELADSCPPSVLATDLRMDPLDGVSLATLLIRRWPDLPVLFVSGYDAEHLDLAGPLLKKPFTPGDLVNAVHQRILLSPSQPFADRAGIESGPTLR